MNTVLEIKNLCKKYPSFELKDVSFSLKEGSIMGFIGRNGAGKTTTIKSILNFVHPSSGSIVFFGKEMIGNEDEIKQLIGYAPGGINYYPMKTLKKITKITKSFYSSWNDELYEKYMKAFKLDENKKPKELSEGMKVKYNLVLALSHGAELLILDEPTSGLDPVSRDELLTIFEKLRDKGTSILFSTHITSDLEKCADSITYIKQGQIVDSSSKEDFIRNQGDGSLEEIMVRLEKEEIDI
ncbi:MAG: ABC transporter ATP-binding protein [Treponema sp.]|nr:ABC transporter ATP-binding protein [Treponema sp.]